MEKGFQAEAACRGDVEDKASIAMKIDNIERDLSTTENSILTLKSKIHATEEAIEQLQKTDSLFILDNKIGQITKNRQVLEKTQKEKEVIYSSLSKQQARAKHQPEQVEDTNKKPANRTSEIQQLESELEQLQDVLRILKNSLMSKNTERDEFLQKQGKHEYTLKLDKIKLLKLEIYYTKLLYDLEDLKAPSPSHSKSIPPKGSHTRSLSSSHFHLVISPEFWDYNPAKANTNIETNHTKIKDALDHTYCTTKFKKAIKAGYNVKKQDKIPADMALDIPSVESILTSPDTTPGKQGILSALIERSLIIKDLISKSFNRHLSY